MQAEEPGVSAAPGARDAPAAQGRARRAPGPELRLSRQLLPELYTFVARVLFYLAPVYLAGYLGLGITWLLLGALLWMWWRRNRRGKLGRLEAAFEFLDNERQFISRELRGQHLPAWVSRSGRMVWGQARGWGDLSGLGRNLHSARKWGRADPKESCVSLIRFSTAPGAQTVGPGTVPWPRRWERGAWVSGKGPGRERKVMGRTHPGEKRGRLGLRKVTSEGNKRHFFHLPLIQRKNAGHNT
jgi:hypothetical protein